MFLTLPLIGAMMVSFDCKRYNPSSSVSKESNFCYIQFLKIWDSIFAFVYTLMYTFWIRYFFKNKRIFLIIPILAMIADWSENYIELLMLETYLNSSPISEIFVSLGSGINSFKWSLSILTYLIILIGIITTLKIFITNSIFRKKTPQRQERNINV